MHTCRTTAYILHTCTVVHVHVHCTLYTLYMCMCVCACREFGAKVVNVKQLLKAMPGMFEHSDKTARAEVRREGS